jgi:cytochrome c5
MVVIGLLVIVAFGIYFGAKAIAARTQDTLVLQDPAVKGAVAERLDPVGKVAVAGKDNSALEPPKAAATVAQDLPGDQVYGGTCVACHGAGVAGAPKYGDKAAWAPRIAKGADTLHQHAIQGFQGSSGFMPAKGGRADLSDKSIVGAVDYMMSAAK